MNGNEGHIERYSVDEARLDVTIDTVAREMTEGEPSGAFRARVLERIEQGRGHVSPGVPRWAWAGAAAAALMLAVAAAVWVVSPLRNQDTAQSTAAEQLAAGPGSERPVVQPATVPGQSAPAEGMPAAAPRRGRAVAVRSVQAAGLEGAQDFNAVPALAEIEPLRIAPVEPPPLHIADVEIAQITEMPSIEIPSLDPGSNDIQSADPKKEK